MLVKELHEINGRYLEYHDLLNYLSQIVLSKTNEEIKKKRESYLGSKLLLKTSKNDLRKKRERLLELSKEIGRVNILLEVVSTIDTLCKESVLYGDKRSKVLALLDNLLDKDSQQLMVILDRLRVYVPEDISRITNS